MVQARRVRVRNGREVIQVRVDLGMLQIETAGRRTANGSRVRHLFSIIWHSLADRADSAGKDFLFALASSDVSRSADREFLPAESALSASDCR